MKYRTVCDAAELQRLMALQCRVNDRPMEGVPANRLMFLLDGGERVGPDAFAMLAKLLPVFRPGMFGLDAYRPADLSFLAAWERVEK